ncbi:brassinosteroid signalling positive regulator family protein, partial [Striga asiatica]
METLVIAHHRNHNQFYSRNQGGYSSTKFGSFGSPPSGNISDINCRTFQSEEGLLPNPFETHPTKIPLSEKAFSASISPKTQSLNRSQKPRKGFAKSRTIDIPIEFKIESSEGGFDFSERWAGPAYSNSPPPSSLPIPKFSLRPKRSISLDLPNAASEINFHPIAKSAPVSPTRERSPSPGGPFEFPDSGTWRSFSLSDIFDLSDSGNMTSHSPSDPVDISVTATLTLRRILNLDDTDN